jgi:PPOX class probable FMN-dependent enzyme
MNIVDDPRKLRTVYPMPSERVANKVLPQLGHYMREFIELSPFVIVATSGEGVKIDASPRGDAPGFVRVVDEQTLHLPDRPGNNRLDSSHNLLSNAHVGMIFFVPGVNESLRVNGHASITFDQTLCDANAAGGKAARAVWVIAIDEAFFHCGKALIRSDLWNPQKRVERSMFPTYGKICADQFGGQTKEEYDQYFEEGYRTRLY